MVTKSYKVISCWLQYCNPLLRWLLPCPAAPGLMLALLCYCLPCYCCWVRALLCGPSQISWMCFNFRKHATSRGRARAAASSASCARARAAASCASCARARARRQLHQQWRQTLRMGVESNKNCWSWWSHWSWARRTPSTATILQANNHSRVYLLFISLYHQTIIQQEKSPVGAACTTGNVWQDWALHAWALYQVYLAQEASWIWLHL